MGPTPKEKEKKNKKDKNQNIKRKRTGDRRVSKEDFFFSFSSIRFFSDSRKTVRQNSSG